MVQREQLNPKQLSSWKQFVKFIADKKLLKAMF